MSSMMRVFITLIVLLLISTVFSQSASQLRKTGEDKLKWLLTQSKKNPLIKISPSTFKTYVTTGPRPYNLLVIFTALGSNYKCAMCLTMNTELIELSNWYENNRYEGEKVKHTGFFVEVDFEANQEIFRQMNLQSAPVIIYMGSTESGNSTVTSKLLTEAAGQNSYNIQKFGASADGIQKFFVSRSSIGYDTVPNYAPPPDYTNLFIIGSFVVSIIFLIRLINSTFPSFFYNPMVYFAFSLVFFLFCASGGVYNIIRGMPFMHSDKGQAVYFHPDQSQQFGMESVIMGFLYLCGALSMILINQYGVITDKNNQPRVTVMLILVAAFQVVFSFVRTMYTRKNGSYNFGYLTR